MIICGGTSPHTSSSGRRTTSSPPTASRRPYPQPALADVGIQASTAGTDGTACLLPASAGGGVCSSSTTTSPPPATFGSRTHLLRVNTGSRAMLLPSTLVSTHGKIRRDENTTVGCAINQPITQVEEQVRYHSNQVDDSRPANVVRCVHDKPFSAVSDMPPQPAEADGGISP